MSLSSFSIKKPVTTAMIYIAFCLFGMISLTRLPIELYPDISMGQISIIVYIRGGIPPTEVESMIAKPVEEAVSTVSHLENMLSISKEGECTVVLSFEQGIDMQLAAMEVREKFAKVKDKLPKECEKPIIAQFSQTDMPIVILAVTSNKRTQEELRRYVDESIKERFKRIKGVANVEVGGGRERKLMLEVDKNALNRHQITMNQFIHAVGANNLNILLGDMEQGTGKVLIRGIGQFDDIKQLSDAVVISRPDGSAVRVKDIAEVKDSYMEAQTYSRINVKPVVSVYIQKESKGNTIEVANAIVKEIDDIKTTLPKDVGVIVTKNQADFIKKSIANLTDSLFRGAVMIILILMLFMAKWSRNFGVAILAGLLVSIFAPNAVIHIFLVALTIFVVCRMEYRPVLIVAIALPISLIITFGFMDFSNMINPSVGLTINFITLFGLALGVGLLVDDSIVVFENIVSKTEKGMDKFRAAIEGSVEMNVVIFASTLTTVIVFLPMLFVSKSMSLLYGGVAWTVTFSLTTSLFVSLMIVPLMSSRLSAESHRNVNADQAGFLKPFYGFQKRAILYTFRNRFMIMAVMLALFLASLFIYGKIGKEYLGSTEQNRFTTFVELPTGAKLDASDEIVRKVERMLKEVPEVKDFTSRVEAWSSKIYVNLVGLDQRQRSVGEVIESLRPKVARLQPAFIYFEEEQEVGTKEVILDVFGYDYEVLREIAYDVTTKMGKIPYFSDAKIRMREGRPELWLRIDKKKAGVYDMTTRDIADDVHAAVRGVRATDFHTGKSEVETISQFQEKDRRTVKDIHLLTVAKRGEEIVTLDQVADFEYGLGPSEIWRKDRSRMIQVSANIGEIPLGKAVHLLMEQLSDRKLPEDYYYEIGGDYESLVRTQNEFMMTIVVILVLIYLVLASMFESFRQPFIIMVTVLLATIGAIFSLYFTKTSIGMGALIGMMMLAGIVVKNGIILVDHANSLKAKQRNVFRLLVVAAHDRLRPVLMTSLCTIFGLVPMAIDKSEGSNLWHPLAVTVIGGLGFSTPLTLIIVPAIYSIFEQFAKISRSGFGLRSASASMKRFSQKIKDNFKKRRED
jgi:HAE1 family hydrophobic/amphiphilic exporter-1